MTTRLVMASRRFPKEYVEFLRKYNDLAEGLREFLTFRQTHLPNESFGTKDSRMKDTKLRHCHLVHGKAILIYQLHGSEIRLISLQEHDGVETNQIIQYHRSLQADDYYTFNIDDPIPAKPTFPFTPVYFSQPEVPEQVSETTPEPATQQPPPGTNGTINPLWDDKVIRYLQGRQMLVERKPANPMVAFVIDREIIAPRGDVLLFDPAVPTVYHLSQAEYEAGFRTYSKRQTTDLGEAFAVAMQPTLAPVSTPTRVDRPVPAAKPAKPAKPEPTPQAVQNRRPIKNNISAQTGRLLAIIAHLQQTTQSNRIDSRSMKELLVESDKRSASTTLFQAQKQGLVKKVGHRQEGHGYYYCLTPKGEKQARLLGNWSYNAIGLQPAFKTRQNATVAA